MNAYLVLIMLLVPTPAGKSHQMELAREWVSASSDAACAAHAARQADEARQRHAAELARLGAKVIGVCEPKGQMS